MRVRSTNGVVRGLGGALLLSTVLSGDPVVRSVHADAARAARAAQVRGDHVVRAEPGPKGVELLLKDGFSLRVRGGQAAASRAALTLRVAASRAPAAAIASEFVPIGPCVAADGADLHADVAYRADAFHVRQGHRLVLALERPNCAAQTGCWMLLEAAYRESRCLARDVVLPGGRLQFGSVPVSAGAGSSRSAAP